MDDVLRVALFDFRMDPLLAAGEMSSFGWLACRLTFSEFRNLCFCYIALRPG